MASNKVAMPMSAAGIVGMSSDMKISGREIDPKIILVAVVLLVITVHVASYVFPA